MRRPAQSTRPTTAPADRRALPRPMGRSLPLSIPSIPSSWRRGSVRTITSSRLWSSSREGLCRGSSGPRRAEWGDRADEVCARDCPEGGDERTPASTAGSALCLIASLCPRLAGIRSLQEGHSLTQTARTITERNSRIPGRQKIEKVGRESLTLWRPRNLMFNLVLDI